MSEVEIGEAKVGGEREELVIGSDVTEVLKMNKDELKAYAYSRFGIKLSLHKKIKLLKLQVATLIKEKIRAANPNQEQKEAPKEEGPKKQNPKLLLHTGNGRVFEWTPLLAKRSDMVACNNKGKKL